MRGHYLDPLWRERGNIYVCDGSVDQGRTLCCLDSVGEMEPVTENETEAHRQQNRRVEAAILASENYQAEARRTTGD